MNTSDTPVTEMVKDRASSSTRTRLRQPWPLIGSLIVIAIAVVGLSLTILSFVNSWEAMLLPCDRAKGINCEDGIFVEDAQLIESIGLSMSSVRLMVVGFAASFIFVCLSMTVVILWRRSDDWMGLLTALFLVVVGTQLSTGDQQELIRVYPALHYPLALLHGLATGLILPFGLLFPNGRFFPRWTRFVAPVWTVLIIFTSRLFLDDQSRLGGVIGQFSIVLLVSAMLLVAAAQFVRYRRVSTPVERQQTKWNVISLIFVIITLSYVGGFIVISPPNAGVWRLIYMLDLILIFPVVVLTFPLTIGISLLRYRLWDVDFVINRSLVYGGLTLLVLGVFGALFFAARAILSATLGAQQDLLAVALPAAVVVGLFNPARKWLRALVDQRLYGIKIDYSHPDTPIPSPVAASHTLTTSAGVYENLEPIGQGGMAEVYKAAHPTLGKPVAIKILPSNLAKDADFRKRFEREARTVAALQHPNIVQMLDFGESDGTHYMVMEYIAGHDLSVDIRQSAPMPLDRVIPILADIASALDYAHAQGLVHRDIKPSNVMLESGDKPRAVLMDFGIARMALGGTRLTATGMLGTFDYMSPEQINDASDVEGRADVYALGVMAYQMLTGRLPFIAGSAGALLMLHLRQPAPDPRDLAKGLPEPAALTIMRAMAKKPEQRFSTAGEFVNAMVA